MAEEDQEGQYQSITIISPFLSTYYIITPIHEIDKITFFKEERVTVLSTSLRVVL